MSPEAIKKIIEEFLEEIGVSCDGVEFFDGEEEGIIRFLVKTKEPEVLIGKDGITLLAVNHIVRRMAEKAAKEGIRTNFIIDVNDYQKNKIEELRQKARMMAERVRFFKSSIELEPMSSYERMIVHSYLISFPEIATESAGTGPSRHIVIKYKGNNPQETNNN